MSKSLHYMLIAAIHIGFLALPVGVPHAAVLTIEVGQHQPFLNNNRVAVSTTNGDTDTQTLGADYLSVYQEADWFNWPIYASDGTAPTVFQFVYDGGSIQPVPEISTCMMTLISGLLIAAKFTKQPSLAAKALHALFRRSVC